MRWFDKLTTNVEKSFALTVRPEPVEGCECDVFKQNWYITAG
jgi:hypothetical protein